MNDDRDFDQFPPIEGNDNFDSSIAVLLSAVFAVVMIVYVLFL